MSGQIESSTDTPIAGPSRTSTAPIMNGGNSGSIDLTEDSDGDDQPTDQTIPGPSSSRPVMNSRAASSSSSFMQAGFGAMGGFEDGNFSNGNVNGNGLGGPSSAFQDHHQPQHHQFAQPSLSPRRTMHPSPSPSIPAFGQASFGQPSFASNSTYGMNPNYSNNSNHSTHSNHFNSPYNQSSTIYSPRPQPSPGQYHPQINGGSNGIGSSSNSNSVIDLTSANLPSPPRHNPKAPLFIGAITTEAMMFYPSPLMVMGSDLSGMREKVDIVQFKGAEFVKVKLKYRAAGAKPKPGDPWTAPKTDIIQVLSPGMTEYIGELNRPMTDILCSVLSRGLLRLEGFAMRLHPDAHKYQIRVNCMLFTLPANVRYISDTLQANNLYLLDPVPPYEPDRHADHPVYENPHGGGAISFHAAQRAQASLHNNGWGAQNLGAAIGQERINAIEVTRRQVDEVFTTLEVAGELDQSDPGPYIKTQLFPHQRKALTFLLQREQDSSALKRGKKYAERAMRKKDKGKEKNGTGSSTTKDDKEKKADGATGDRGGNGSDEEKGEKEEKEDEQDGQDGEKTAAIVVDGSADATPVPEDSSSKPRDNRTLWEAVKDDKGKVRKWKNRVTGEFMKTKKGEKPPDCKGAILADDMGLGKTLSIVSLIAATRRSAKKWQKTDPIVAPPEIDTKPELDPSAIKTKVFGMPDIPDPEDKGTKRKRNDPDSPPPPPKSGPSLKSRGTLLVCPMSTISNWEDQLREHWNGRVEVIGGASGQALKPPEKKWKPPKYKRAGGAAGDDDSSDEDELDTLKVYIYHGPSRCSDPEIIADFDIVMTSYNTLANEYSKSGMASEDTPAETANNSDEEFTAGDTSTNSRAVKPEVEAEIKANEVADALSRKKKKAGSKGTATAARLPERSPLQSIAWFRIVLDEAHYIKTPSTVASRAACAVDADRRIALTGTPIQNKIEDIWALFKFLRLKPIDDKVSFTKFISGPCKTGQQIGVARLQLVMRVCTLRRTKDSTADDGRRILNLPARKETQVWLDLREDERQAYEARQREAKAQVAGFEQEGTLQKNYANVLQEILRLRQICDHVDLAMLDPVEEDYDGAVMDYEVAVSGINRHGLSQPRAQSVVCFMKDGEGATCNECGYDFNDYFPSLEMAELDDARPKKKLPTPLLLTKCLHVYCTKCFKASVHPGWSKRMKDQAARACGVCQSMLRLPADVIDVLPPDSSDSLNAQLPADAPKRSARKRYVRPPGEKPNLSTKMQYLYDELIASSKKNHNSPNYDPFSIANSDDVEELDQDGKPFIVKSVIFSQWTTMLDRIGDMLDEAQIRYARLDGTMTREDRAKACDSLRHNKKTEVLLVSTRAGGVGLNLTAASRCFLVDPYWNPSVEAQAIDRIHRMGQTRPVTAIKLMINNSVEQKLHALQQKKANLAQISLNKLSRKELMAQKAEELAELFR